VYSTVEHIDLLINRARKELWGFVNTNRFNQINNTRTT